MSFLELYAHHMNLIRQVLVTIYRSFVLPEMLCFWDYIRLFYSEEDLDLLVSTLYVC